MALSRILALLSLVAALLLADALPFHHGSSRLRGSPVADLLLAALDRLHDVSLVDLATRRNMVLLCHAILLVLLGDAGILAHPSARGTRLAVAVDRDPCAAPPLTTGHEGEVAEHVSTKEIVLVEKKQGNSYLQDRRLVAIAGELDQPAAAITTISRPMDSGRALVADQEKNGAEEAGEGEPADNECGGGEEEDDLDEMNRRFEAFIASTKEKMRLEALLQPAHVSSGENRALLPA